MAPPVEPIAPPSQPQADPEPATPEADLTVEVLEYQEIAAGSVSVDVQVTNRGPDPAEAVVLSAEWITSAPGLAVSGSLPAPMPIGSLSPQGQQRTTLDLEISSGTHDLTVSVQSETREINPEDNAGRMSLVLDYFSVKTGVPVLEMTGYNQDGYGIIELEVSVSNLKPFATAPYVLGVVCLSGEFPECPAPLALDSLEPGQDYTGSLTLLAPQGVSEIVIAASDNPDYNFEQAEQDPDRQAVVQLEVPERPATALLVEADSQVLGYYSDGAAEVEVTASLTNLGYRPLTETQSIPIRCSLPQNANGHPCSASARLNFQLPDGFGPAEKTFTMKLPMGQPVLEFGTARNPIAQVEMDVPERILGVDREVWECYSDRPGVVQFVPGLVALGEAYGGCGGWYRERVSKWTQTGTVRVWATGPAEYIDTLTESLDELGPLLELAFEWVDTVDEADLQAYVGVSEATAMEAGVHCEEAAGCAHIRTNSRGIVFPVRIWVEQRNENHLGEVGLVWEYEIKHTTSHEVVHALSGMIHRHHPGSLMNIHNGIRSPNLSPMDDALVRLNSHPLVKHGMTMNEVAELVIFADELLDPSASKDDPTPYEVATRVFVALQEAETARWYLRGGWGGGRGCNDFSFGRADFVIGQFVGKRATLIHFDDNVGRYFIIRPADNKGPSEYWEKQGSGWNLVDSDAIFDETHWRSGFSSPHIMLTSVLYFGEPDSISMSQPEPGFLEIKAGLGRTSLGGSDWHQRVNLDISMLVDAETYVIRDYRMRWRFGGTSGKSCLEHTATATSGEYGVDIDIPDEIEIGSDNLG